MTSSRPSPSTSPTWGTSPPIKIVHSARKAGKSLDAAKKAGLPEEYKSWGEGFIKTDKWIERIYSSAK